MNSCSSIHNLSIKKENRQMTILLSLATKSFIEPIQESFFLRLDRCAQALRQFFEDFPLFLGELGRHRHIDDHELIAASTAAQMGHTFIPDLKDFARLSPGGNLQFLITIQRRDVDPSTESGLCDVDVEVQ